MGIGRADLDDVLYLAGNAVHFGDHPAGLAAVELACRSPAQPMRRDEGRYAETALMSPLGQVENGDQVSRIRIIAVPAVAGA